MAFCTFQSLNENVVKTEEEAKIKNRSLTDKNRIDADIPGIYLKHRCIVNMITYDKYIIILSCK